jgi:hypothetical protein
MRDFLIKETGSSPPFLEFPSRNSKTKKNTEQENKDSDKGKADKITTSKL